MARPATREQDLELLHILDLHKNQGLSGGKIAKQLKTTKNSIIGKIHRVRMDEILECRCVRLENKDGGMPPRWWEQK